MRRERLVFAGLVAYGLGCNAIAGIERAQLGQADAGADASSAIDATTGAGEALLGAPCEDDGECRTRACDRATKTCVCPPGMVRIARAAGTRIEFCMDATEVTNAAYQQFLYAAPPFEEQIPECRWNTRYVEGSGPASLPPSHPVRSIDWCDAHAYCRWAGKRLCGRVGGGSAGSENPASGESEWFVACSAEGTRTFPYGSSYDPLACVGADRTSQTSTSEVDVGSVPSCVGGSEGVFDLSGNVWEYEDACLPDPDGGVSPEQDLCRRRGGSHDSSEKCLGCDVCTSSFRARASYSSETGVRCCSG